MGWQHSLQIKNGKTRFTSSGKSMTEFKFYNQLEPGTKDKKKPRYESKNMVLNQAQRITLENSNYILEWL